eukprot:749034-Hanusia_phi.AAC.1
MDVSKGRTSERGFQVTVLLQSGRVVVGDRLLVAGKDLSCPETPALNSLLDSSWEEAKTLSSQPDKRDGLSPTLPTVVYSLPLLPLPVLLSFQFSTPCSPAPPPPPQLMPTGWRVVLRGWDHRRRPSADERRQHNGMSLPPVQCLSFSSAGCWGLLRWTRQVFARRGMAGKDFSSSFMPSDICNLPSP